MTKKEKLTPGTDVRVNGKSNESWGSKSPGLLCFPTSPPTVSDLNTYIIIPPDEIVTVIEGPRKLGPINIIEFKYKNKRYNSYWTSFRIHTDHIKEIK